MLLKFLKINKIQKKTNLENLTRGGKVIKKNLTFLRSKYLFMVIRNVYITKYIDVVYMTDKFRFFCLGLVSYMSPMTLYKTQSQPQCN